MNPRLERTGHALWVDIDDRARTDERGRRPLGGGPQSCTSPGSVRRRVPRRRSPGVRDAVRRALRCAGLERHGEPCGHVGRAGRSAGTRNAARQRCVPWGLAA